MNQLRNKWLSGLVMRKYPMKKALLKKLNISSQIAQRNLRDRSRTKSLSDTEAKMPSKLDVHDTLTELDVASSILRTKDLVHLRDFYVLI